MSVYACFIHNLVFLVYLHRSVGVPWHHVHSHCCQLISTLHVQASHFETMCQTMAYFQCPSLHTLPSMFPLLSLRC